MIRLLYGLTKQAIKKMKSADIDEQLRKVDAEELDAARKLGPKTQKKLDTTRKALDEEKSIRKVRDTEYGYEQDDLRAASEWIPTTKPPTLKEPPGIYLRDTTGMVTNKPPTGGIQSMARGGGDDVIPEFSSKNLAMKEIENGVPSGNTLDPRAGYMGPKISTEGNPLALKDITFGQLDETGKGVYSAVKESGIEEFSDPGVLADVLDYARRAGRGRAPNEIVSEYWNKNGNNIRTYLDDIKSGMGPDGPQPGQQMDLFLD